MSRIGHPSARRLLRWIESEDDAIEKHLQTCDHCADRLESLVEDSDPVLQMVLAQVLAAPEQIPQRIQSAIDERMNSRRDLMLLGELFGLPLRTVRVMATESGE